MKQLTQNSVIVALLAFVAGVGLWYVVTEQRFATLADTLEEQVLASEAAVRSLVSQTGRAQVDEVVESIHEDCTVRTAFEDKLGRLQSLSAAQLQQTLDEFHMCGQHFSVQKAVMVLRSEMAFQELERDVAALAVVRPDAAKQYQVEQWREVIAKENARSALMRKQVELQGDIIRVLQVGDEVELERLLGEVQDTRQSLEVVALQITSELERLGV